MANRYRLTLTVKKPVLDPQGEAVLRALNSQGFDQVKKVRVGKIVDLDLSDDLRSETANALVEKAAEDLLCNSLIEDYEIQKLNECGESP